jgi:uncharacterized membrane protein
MAGVFFAFSTAVMSGLAKLEPAQGLTAMQSINRTILNPVFLTVFMGSAALCAITAFTSFGKWHSSSALLFFIGSALYLVGSFLVTSLINVPLNNTLDAVVLGSPEAVQTWRSYLTTWTAWNHVRSVASLLATTLLILGLLL